MDISNGIILQWGKVTVSSSEGENFITIMLPISITQANSIAVCGGIGGSGWQYLNGVGIKGSGLPSFDLWHSFGNGVNIPITWITVGY